MLCRRNQFRIRLMSVALVKDQLNCARQPRPTILLDGELLPSGGGEGIELRLASGFRLFPFGLKPSLLFQAVECRIERSLIELNDGPGDLFQALRNAVAVC